MADILIVVHPGSFIAHSPPGDFHMILSEMRHHDGPIIIVDGDFSDKTWPYDKEIAAIFATKHELGFHAVRIWGCDAGISPRDKWDGDRSAIYDEQMEAAEKYILPFLREKNIIQAILTGGWATRDDSEGCVNSVGQALDAAGWAGTWEISDSALFVEDHGLDCDEFEDDLESDEP